MGGYIGRMEVTNLGYGENFMLFAKCGEDGGECACKVFVDGVWQKLWVCSL